MAAVNPCLVIYGNSVFLAGIKAELESEHALALDVLTIEAGCIDAPHLLRERKPCAVLFDLNLHQPDFLIPMLCELPSLLIIGVDPSSNEMLVLTSRPVPAQTAQDLVHVILEASQLQENATNLQPQDYRK